MHYTSYCEYMVSSNRYFLLVYLVVILTPIFGQKPGYKYHTIQPSETVYNIAVVQYGISIEELLRANPQIGKDMKIREGHQLLIPLNAAKRSVTSTNPQPKSQAQSPVPQTKTGIHVVKPGETVYNIAVVQHGISVAQLIEQNPEIGWDYMLKVGQVLKISENTAQEVLPEDHQLRENKEGYTHIVKAGETVYNIAVVQHHLSVEELVAANPAIGKNYNISVGQELYIPSDATPTGAEVIRRNRTSNTAKNEKRQKQGNTVGYPSVDEELPVYSTTNEERQSKNDDSGPVLSEEASVSSKTIKTEDKPLASATINKPPKETTTNKERVGPAAEKLKAKAEDNANDNEVETETVVISPPSPSKKEPVRNSKVKEEKIYPRADIAESNEKPESDMRREDIAIPSPSKQVVTKEYKQITNPTENKSYPDRLVIPSSDNEWGQSRISIVATNTDLAAISAQYGVSIDNLMEWNNTRNMDVEKGQKIIIKKTSFGATQPVRDELKPIYVTTHRPDNLVALSAKYGFSVEKAKRWNDVNSNYLSENQTLVIENGSNIRSANSNNEFAASEQVNVRSGTVISNERSSTAARFDRSVKDAASENSRYVHVSNRDIHAISTQYGVSVGELMRWNNLQYIEVEKGSKLRIKKQLGEEADNLLPNGKGRKLYLVTTKTESVYTLSTIYGVSVKEIKRWNNLNSDRIEANKTIIILSDN